MKKRASSLALYEFADEQIFLLEAIITRSLQLYGNSAVNKQRHPL